MPLALALLVGSPVVAAPMHYADFQKLVQPPTPGPILAYGADPLQHVELWKPAGKGPFPVVLMLHGGCWQTGVAKADIMHLVAADLMKRGIAVWNVEYRGVDVPGGGYPGTFRDVAAAADLLARAGPKLGLDTRHVVAVGHSAGGHLALWLAGRPRLPRSSLLWSPTPARIVAVVSLGGLPDLPMAKRDAADACGADTVDRLVGPRTRAHPDPYADTSPDRLLPLGVAQILISGAEDPIAPHAFADDWIAKVAAVTPAGGEPEAHAMIVPDSGHFELIAPGTAAWGRAVAFLVMALAL